MWIFKPSQEEISAGSKCRSCEAAIVWAITLNGSKAPINADFAPLESKKFKIAGGVEVEIIAVSNKAAHFSTCPQKNQWRKTK
jgi:hypothetical protein